MYTVFSWIQLNVASIAGSLRLILKNQQSIFLDVEKLFFNIFCNTFATCIPRKNFCFWFDK